jgi:hypothetical protein
MARTFFFLLVVALWSSTTMHSYPTTNADQDANPIYIDDGVYRVDDPYGVKVRTEALNCEWEGETLCTNIKRTKLLMCNRALKFEEWSCPVNAICDVSKNACVLNGLVVKPLPPSPPKVDNQADE